LVLCVNLGLIYRLVGLIDRDKYSFNTFDQSDNIGMIKRQNGMHVSIYIYMCVLCFR